MKRTFMSKGEQKIDTRALAQFITQLCQLERVLKRKDIR